MIPGNVWFIKLTDFENKEPCLIDLTDISMIKTYIHDKYDRNSRIIFKSHKLACDVVEGPDEIFEKLHKKFDR